MPGMHLSVAQTHEPCSQQRSRRNNNNNKNGVFFQQRFPFTYAFDSRHVNRPPMPRADSSATPVNFCASFPSTTVRVSGCRFLPSLGRRFLAAVRQRPKERSNRSSPPASTHSLRRMPAASSAPASPPGVILRQHSTDPCAAPPPRPAAPS